MINQSIFETLKESKFEGEHDYQNLRNEGVDVSTALEKSCREVGHALIYTSFILSLGFLAFTLSASKPFTYFGILSSLSIFTALLADLFLLPTIIFWLEKKPSHLENRKLA